MAGTQRRDDAVGAGKSTQSILAGPERAPVQSPSHHENEPGATLVVPKSLHSALKAAAAKAGVKLYQFIEPALRDLVEQEVKA